METKGDPRTHSAFGIPVFKSWGYEKEPAEETNQEQLFR